MLYIARNIILVYQQPHFRYTESKNVLRIGLKKCPSWETASQVIEAWMLPEKNMQEVTLVLSMAAIVLQCWMQCSLDFIFAMSFSHFSCRDHLCKIFRITEINNIYMQLYNGGRRYGCDQQSKDKSISNEIKQTNYPHKSSWHFFFIKAKQGHLRQSQHRRRARLSSAKNKTHGWHNDFLTELDII